MKKISAKQQEISADTKLPFRRYFKQHWILYAMTVPGILFFLIFKYIPMGGLIIAFKNYNPYLGVWGSPWVGLEQFRIFFTGNDFGMLLRNTLTLFIMSLLFYFPLPIILSLLLNEIKHSGYKKLAQTFVYIPHFVSWVIVYSITYLLLNKGSGVGASGGGIIYEVTKAITGQPILFFESNTWSRWLVIFQQIWKESGWGTVIFLAALSGVNAELYEAAEIDGAGRLKKMWHITLPSIKGIIIIMLIMRVGSILNTGFEQIYLLQNLMNRKSLEVFDTYVYKQGITNASFSYSTAVGMFKGIVGAIMVLSTDRIAKLAGESGLY